MTDAEGGRPGTHELSNHDPDVDALHQAQGPFAQPYPLGAAIHPIDTGIYLDRRYYESALGSTHHDSWFVLAGLWSTKVQLFNLSASG
jgi:hypothetical protein